MRFLTPRRLPPTGLALLVMLAASACATLSSAPGAAPLAMAGLWQRDAAASDDFDRKLVPLIEHERQRLLPRRGPSGMGGHRGGGSTGSDEGSGVYDLEALVMPPEDPEQMRTRLANDLRPPAALRIGLPGDAVEITNDAEPVRQFLPGQAVSRIDSSGAASLTSGWDQRAFVVRARYTNHASRGWRYELESSGAVLRLSFEADDPEFGKLSLVTRYRRAK